jgi:aspartate-semialdehyde dehydrogenase
LTQRIAIGVLGATGTVGERLVRLVHDHPWFELREIGASDRSAGETLASRLPPSEMGDLPDAVGSMVLKSVDDTWESPLLLSALPSDVAREVEPRLAGAGHLVVSNASTHRQQADVPLIIPEVNADHLALLDAQAGRWPGALLTNPNCVVAGIALAMAPLKEAFGLEKVVVTTFQAISGAGRPGPAAADLVDNVLPWIAGEEDKMGAECRKILGQIRDGRIVEADLRLSATATRVPVTHGHLASLSLAFREDADPARVADALRAFRGQVADDALPLAPEHPIVVLDEPDRPQPRVDRDRGGGMTVTVGRIRPCEVHHVKLMVLSHNLVRGAAGAALLDAELCHARGITARYGRDVQTREGRPAERAGD